MNIVNFNDRAVEILEISYARHGEDSFIMSACYLDDGSELSNYELDILGEIYPDVLDGCHRERVMMRLENLCDDGR